MAPERLAEQPAIDVTITAAGRPHTPPQRIRNADGTESTRITVQRYCHDCGTHLGDATDAEIEAAIAGGRLLASDCPTCHPKAAPTPASTAGSSTALTLDGSLDDYGVRSGAMRWVPPERAAAVRAAAPGDRRSMLRRRNTKETSRA
ncbi:hypothetical protein OOJ91_34095 [Micromonospora lupini]|uniref:hypothetical protein n=1 Tax=Micromonospora lupini TaxID=285679 RepID=UPI002251D21C|nr:hypothetical protein [Micromonospora lupini]MCX5070881.1 hypothetical protein [Micromonospora lupini]